MKTFAEFLGRSKTIDPTFSESEFIDLGSLDKITKKIIEITRATKNKKKLFDTRNKESLISIVAKAIGIIGLKNKMEFPIDMYIELIQRLKKEKETRALVSHINSEPIIRTKRISTNTSKRFTKVKGGTGRSSTGDNDPNSELVNYYNPMGFL
jgi:hypothetical protein